MSGSGVGFDYFNGGSDNGLFGSFVGLVMEVFNLMLVGFVVFDGGDDIMIDCIEVDLIEIMGDLSFICIVELGSYIVGMGGSVFV